MRTRGLTGRYSRNFEYTFAKPTHRPQCRRKPTNKPIMNFRPENKRGKARPVRENLSYMCRATMSRSSNPASHDPDRLSRECRRYVAFNCKNHGVSTSGDRTCQGANQCQSPVVQANRLEARVTVWDSNTAICGGGGGGQGGMETGGT